MAELKEELETQKRKNTEEIDALGMKNTRVTQKFVICIH